MARVLTIPAQIRKFAPPARAATLAVGRQRRIVDARDLSPRPAAYLLLGNGLYLLLGDGSRLNVGGA